MTVGADVIIAALGARPIKPPIPGIEGHNVLSAEKAYSEPEKVGAKAVILGAGLVGMELGIYLAMLGRKIAIVEMLDKVNDGGNFQHFKAIKVEMKRYQIDLHLSTKAVEINERGVKCISSDKEKFFEADTIIYAVGQEPLIEEASSLRFCAAEFYQIGDCVVPKDIMSATSTAHTIARNIGR